VHQVADEFSSPQVEPIYWVYGFRFTQLNLHFVGSIVQCETQQWIFAALSVFCR